MNFVINENFKAKIIDYFEQYTQSETDNTWIWSILITFNIEDINLEELAEQLMTYFVGSFNIEDDNGNIVYHRDDFLFEDIQRYIEDRDRILVSLKTIII